MTKPDQSKKTKSEAIPSSSANPALQIKAPKLPTKTEFSYEPEKGNTSNKKGRI